MLATPELEIARNLPPANCAPSEAERYTRWLATHHYENFNVVSWLLPRRLHQHFYNLYAYCRWSDDLGDEIADPARALQLLDAWEDELRLIIRMARGPSHPVLIALRETIRAKDIPTAAVSRFAARVSAGPDRSALSTWDDVFDYCVYSANPVGRLVLYLVRLPGRGAAEALGLHLHGVAAGEFLAGCFAGSGEGPYLYSARGAFGSWPDGNGYRREAIRRALRGADESH